MYKCQDCSYSTNWSVNLIRHEKFKHNPSEIKQIYNCQDCTYSTNWKSNLRRHEKFKLKDSQSKETYIMNMVYSNNSRSHKNGMHNEGEFNQNYNNTLNSMNQDV